MKKLLLLPLLSVVLAGCMTPIGKPEFTCPNAKKGGVCGGPRTIHELTNSRTNLEDLDEADFDGYLVTTDEEGNAIAVKSKKAKGEDKENADDTTADVLDAVIITKPDGTQVYVPREHSQHGHSNYQPVQMMPPMRADAHQSDAFRAWPNGTEPLAPEPLAVLQAPKVMRILVSSYKDARGNLNMPGYVYVQVEPETWAFGEAANMRPQRVVPSHINQQTQQNNAARQQREQGISPLEYQPRSNGNGG